MSNMIRPRIVRTLRPITDGMTVPIGTQGILCGKRIHFDLGACLEGGNWVLPCLPIYDALVIGEDVEDLGEWDGTATGFTKQGLRLLPLIAFFADGTVAGHIGGIA